MNRHTSQAHSPCSSHSRCHQRSTEHQASAYMCWHCSKGHYTPENKQLWDNDYNGGHTAMWTLAFFTLLTHGLRRPTVCQKGKLIDLPIYTTAVVLNIILHFEDCATYLWHFCLILRLVKYGIWFAIYKEYNKPLLNWTNHMQSNTPIKCET